MTGSIYLNPIMTASHDDDAGFGTIVLDPMRITSPARNLREGIRFTEGNFWTEFILDNGPSN